jgi:hypothetical protein
MRERILFLFGFAYPLFLFRGLVLSRDPEGNVPLASDEDESSKEAEGNRKPTATFTFGIGRGQVLPRQRVRAEPTRIRKKSEKFDS